MRLIILSFILLISISSSAKSYEQPKFFNGNWIGCLECSNELKEQENSYFEARKRGAFVEAASFALWDWIAAFQYNSAGLRSFDGSKAGNEKAMNYFQEGITILAEDETEVYPTLSKHQKAEFDRAWDILSRNLALTHKAVYPGLYK